jgi:hypothetical protein
LSMRACEELTSKRDPQGRSTESSWDDDCGRYYSHRHRTQGEVIDMVITVSGR